MKKVYLIATIIALITGYAVYIFAGSLQRTTSAVQIPTTAVVVAVKNIGASTVLTEDMVTVRQLPSVSVTPGTASTAESVIGKIAKYPLVAGEQIITSKLAKPGSSDGTNLSYQLTKDERAITISVDDVTGVSGFIREGDLVDILTTKSINSVPTTYYLLKSVRVLKISNKAANSSGSAVSSYNTVTLCLSTDDAKTLGEAINLGQVVRLTLCPVADSSASSTEG